MLKQGMTLFLSLSAFVGVIVLAGWLMVRASKKHMPEVLDAKRAFFEQTGFRHRSLPQGDIEQQVVYRKPGQGLKYGEEYVKPLADGRQIEFFASVEFQGNQQVQQRFWRLILAKPPVVTWQLAERSLSGVGKAAKELLTKQRRSFTAVFPGPVPIGDEALDERFILYTEEPDSVRRILCGEELRPLLLQCAEVELSVDAQKVVFNDPSNKNIQAAYGGHTGALATGLNAAPSIRAGTVVHQRMIDILIAAAQASQFPPRS